MRALPLPRHGHPLRLDRGRAGERAAPARRARASRRPSAGRTSTSTCALVDDEGRDVRAGGVGEIIVRSEFTMHGYWRNPGGDRAHDARRLGAHRRSRRVRRRGVPLHRRAPEGGDPQRRREHLPGRDRARAARPPGRSARRASSASPIRTGARRSSPRSCCATGATLDADDVDRARAARISRATRSRATSASSPSCRARRRRGRCTSRCCGKSSCIGCEGRDSLRVSMRRAIPWQLGRDPEGALA